MNEETAVKGGKRRKNLQQVFDKKKKLYKRYNKHKKKKNINGQCQTKKYHSKDKIKIVL